MIKRASHFLLCAFLIFASSLVMADRKEEPYNVVINNISMTSGVAKRVFANAERNKIVIYDNKGNEIKVVVKDTNVTINSTLMGIIAKLYLDVSVIDHEYDDVISKKDNGSGVVIFIHVKKGEKDGVVEDLIIG